MASIGSILLYVACVVVPIAIVWDGVGLYMLLASLRPQDTADMSLGGGRYSIIMMGTLLVGWLARIHQLRPRKAPLQFLLFLWMGQIIISYIFTTNAAYSTTDAFKGCFLPVAVPFFFIQMLQTRRQVYRAFWFLAAGLAFLGYWAEYLYHFTNYYEMINDNGEMSGPGGQLSDRNDFGLGLNMGLPLAFFLAFAAKRTWVKMLAFVSCAPIAAAILETESRGAAMAMAIIGIYILAKMHHKKWLWALAIVAAVAGLSILSPQQVARLSGIGSAASEDSSAQGRIVSWMAAIEMARQNPLTGVGPGCFTFDQGRYSSARRDSAHALVAHSSFFQTLGEFGIPGAIIWLALIIRTWQVLGHTERKLRHARMKGCREYYMTLALRGSVIGYVIAGAFLSQENLEFWYFDIALTSCLAVLVRKRVAEKKAKDARKYEEETAAGVVGLTSDDTVALAYAKPVPRIRPMTPLVSNDDLAATMIHDPAVPHATPYTAAVSGPMDEAAPADIAIDSLGQVPQGAPNQTIVDSSGQVPQDAPLNQTIAYPGLWKDGKKKD